MPKLKRKTYLFGLIAIMLAIFSCLYLKYPKTTEHSQTSKDYLATGTTVIASKYLLHDITYYGETGTYEVEDDLGVGSTLYSDSAYTITALPYEFTNAEMLLLPSIDASLTNSSLITFTVYKAVNIYILRDPAITTNPSWLSTYTKTNQTVTGSNGITYDVWMMSVSASTTGTNVTIGSNVDNATDLNSAYNQVIFVKETTRVTNHDFFYYDFETDTADDITYGFNLFSGTTYYTTLEAITDSNSVTKNALVFNDTNTSNLVYIQKYFAPLTTDFVVEYKAYVPYDSTNTNKNSWLRMWVSNGIPSSDSDKTKLLAETYLHRTGTSLDVKVLDSTNTAYNLETGISFGVWHTYKYVFDMTNKTYTVYIDGVAGEGVRNGYIETPLFRKTAQNQATYIIFGSGKSSSSYYAIDDVKVYPVMDIGATSITVDGHVINLDKTVSSYGITDSNVSSTATYNLTTTSDYYNHTITYPNDQTAHITIYNNNLETYAFDVNFTEESILTGIDVRGDTTGATIERINNVQAIHILDTSTTNLTYLEKSFNDTTTAIRFSYDVLINDDTINNVSNTLLKSFLTNGQMLGNYDVLTNVGVNAYLNPIGTTTDIGNKVVSSTILDDTTIITKNTWHNIKYEVDIVNQTYKVYLDDVVIISSFNFYTNQTTLNNLVIGSDYAGTADYYIKNISVSEMSGPPIDSITIDGHTLADFNNNTSTYNYYTDLILRSTTNVVLGYNGFYTTDTTNITIDTTNETITINVNNNLGETITYVVNILNPIEQGITKDDLIALYNQALALADNSSAYTAYTWNKVSEAMTNANTVINDVNSVTTDYVLAHYLLDTAINNLQAYETYDEITNVDISETKTNPTATFSSTCKNETTIINQTTSYEVSLISTIQYSTNLNGSFGFEKVMQNGSTVYKKANADDTAITFTSVPYKYMNSEYLLMKNQVFSNSSLKFTVNQDIYVVVFKDWNSGPFNKTITIGSTEYAFTDTNEIATSSAGVIYKIYQSTLPIASGSTIEIDSDYLINSHTTTNNSVVAFIKSNNATNNYFFHEDMDDFATTTEFNKSWDSIISCDVDNHTGSTVGSYNTIINDATGNYLKQYSNGGTEMPIVYKKFASLYEKVQFKFTMYVDDNGGALTASNNKWLRTWLVNFDDDISTGRAISTGTSDKAKTLVDIYAGANNMLYNYHNGGSNITLSNFTTDVNSWYDYVITYDIINQTFTLDVYTAGSSTSLCSGGCTPTNNSFYNYSTTHNNVANYAYFAGRGSQASLSRISDITVTPVASGLYTDIKVDGNTLGTNLYQDLTKAYLYKYDPSISNNLTVTTTNGTLTPTSETITSYPSSTSLNDTTYATIASANTASSINRNYTVYFEANESNKKLDLVNLLDEAYVYTRIEYTTESYNNLLTAITNAEASLANHKITATEVQTLIDNLQAAINNLEKLVDFEINYTGKIISDYHYEDFDASPANITTDSSFTAYFHLSIRTSSSGYPYAGKTHVRYLTTDTTLPVNTKITLVDRNHEDAEYYYYTVTSADYTANKTKYLLDSFKKMGTTDEYFSCEPNYNSTTRILSGNYFFIVDFKDATEAPTAGSHTVAYELDIDGTKVSTSDILTYTIYTETNQISVNSSFDKEYYTEQTTAKLTVEVSVSPIVVNGITVVNTNLDNLISSLRFSFYDSTGTNKISFSKGMILSESTDTYYLSNDDTFRVTHNLPIQSFVRNYTLRSLYDSMPVGNYQIKVEYIGTYNSVNDSKVLAYEFEPVDIRDEPICSIYYAIATGDGFVDRNISSTFNTNGHIKCQSVTDDRYVTLTLYKKTTNLFDSFVYEKVDLNDIIENNYNWSLYNNIANTYLIRHDVYNNDENPDVTETLTGSIKSTAPKGTYKAVYEVHYGNEVNSDFYTFYIK